MGIEWLAIGYWLGRTEETIPKVANWCGSNGWANENQTRCYEGIYQYGSFGDLIVLLLTIGFLIFITKKYVNKKKTLSE